jgi:hypothetical protein
MSAQVKPCPFEQAALDVRLVNRRNDVFEITKAKAAEALLDELQDKLPQYLAELLVNHGTCDDAETGRWLHECIGAFALRLHSARQANELRETFMPSWRSRVEP